MVGGLSGTSRRASRTPRELPETHSAHECNEHRQGIAPARDRMVLPIMVIHALHNPAHVAEGDESADEGEDDEGDLSQIGLRSSAWLWGTAGRRVEQFHRTICELRAHRFV